MRAEMEGLEQIIEIYNQGIEDRIATLETSRKKSEDMLDWFSHRKPEHLIFTALDGDLVVGWGATNSYKIRKSYNDVGELSLYVRREWRGRGVGRLLLEALTGEAKRSSPKLLIYTFSFNALGQSLYRSASSREVGIFNKQGKIDGRWVDVMAMELLLPACEEISK
jgi:phosphinothricin acetyltransferase